LSGNYANNGNKDLTISGYNQGRGSTAKLYFTTINLDGTTITLPNVPSTYSTGGYDVLVRNQTTGNIEKTIISPTVPDTLSNKTLQNPVVLGTMKLGTTPTGSSSDSILVKSGTDSTVKAIARSILGIGSINVQTTDVSNTGTTETDLMSYTVPANTLDADNDALDFDFSYQYAPNTNSKIINVYFGTVVVTMPSNTSGAGGIVRITGKIVRTSSSTLSMWGSMTSSNGATGVPFFATGSTINFGGSLVLKSTGTGGATSDITQHASMVRKLDHP
jgi:hypothetical protein